MCLPNVQRSAFLSNKMFSGNIQLTEMHISDVDASGVQQYIGDYQNAANCLIASFKEKP
jgi:hypothetical protein